MTAEDLLQPLPGDSPAGEDLSFSTDFDAIVEARREDDPTLPLGDWKEKGKEPKAADWPEVRRRCEALLRARTKDLRVGAWLAEAWTHDHGMAGLAQGLVLQASLVERWWDQVHPQPEDGDHELRIGALAWLLKQVLVLARGCVQADAQAASTRADAQAALDALAALQRAVDSRLGADGPSFVAAREALQQARDALPADVPAAAPGPVAASPAAGAASADAALGGVPTTRAQALQQLRQVADFFRRTEPHSPVAYLADKAARWGTMDLHLWLRQVVKDESTMMRLEELLGVEPPRSGG